MSLPSSAVEGGAKVLKHPVVKFYRTIINLHMYFRKRNPKDLATSVDRNRHS